MKTAFITGIAGQDGSYLAEFLLEKNYIVHGLISRPLPNHSHIKHLLHKGRIFLHEGTLENRLSLEQALHKAKPDEIYNFGAISQEQTAFNFPESAANVNAFGVLRLLEIIKSQFPSARFFQASSAELFGQAKEIPQTETTPFLPYSPYGVSKLYAHWTVVNYRETHGLYACNGILFNHESPRRTQFFVSRKISKAAANIQRNLQEKLILGNLNAKRDWGFAKDFIEAIWKIMQQPKPDDFVVSSGELHSVREFVEIAFDEVGIQLIWEGEGVNEKGKDRKTNKVLVEVSLELFRPIEIHSRLGNSAKAREQLGWLNQTKFSDLVRLMVQYDLNEVNE